MGGQPQTGYLVAHTVTWKGKPDLSALKGRPVYPRFDMKKAGPYGFRIAG